MWLHSTRIITPAGTRAGTVVLDGQRISELVDEDHAAGAAGHAEEGLDLGDHWVAPGFIDLHVHGGGGAQCNTGDAEEVLAVARFHAAHGTTALLATTVAAPISELTSTLMAIRRAGASAAHDAAAVLGAHLEGPFLSRTYPGAMDSDQFVAPDRDRWERLLTAAPGTLAMMTLAPELPGALDATAALARAGVVISLGHTNATYDETLAAVDAGASAVTHLFNAMRPLHHRDPGIIGAALDLADLSCELICDGLHVDGPALRIAHRAKGPTGIRLVTDAIEAAGMPDGEYRLGHATVTAHDGQATRPRTGGLAGSTLTMAAAVRNAVWMLGITVEEAVLLASANPARLLGIADRKGAITPGFDADLVVLSDDLHVERTLVAGDWIAIPEPTDVGASRSSAQGSCARRGSSPAPPRSA